MRLRLAQHTLNPSPPPHLAPLVQVGLDQFITKNATLTDEKAEDAHTIKVRPRVAGGAWARAACVAWWGGVYGRRAAHACRWTCGDAK